VSGSNHQFKFHTKAVNFSSARTTKRFLSPRYASAIQIVRPSESIAETQPKLQPALLKLSAMIFQYFSVPGTTDWWRRFAVQVCSAQADHSPFGGRSKRFNLLLLLRDRTPTPTCTKLGHDWPKNEPSRPYNGTRQFDAPQEQLSISVKKMLSKRFLFNDRCRGHFCSHMVFSRLGMFPDYKPYFGAHSV